MSDHPILFSGPMVQALLDGSKTQTRRAIASARIFATLEQRAVTLRDADLTRAFQGAEHFRRIDGNGWAWEADAFEWQAPHTRTRWMAHIGFAPGDRLWVREAHALLPRSAYRMSIGTGTIAQTEHPTDGYSAAVFREGFDRSGRPRWRPSIHLPRWASRLTLTVTDVRVERLQDISKPDAIAEGLMQLPATRRWVASKGDQYFGFAHADPRVVYGWLWNTINGEGAWEANPWVAAYTFTVAHQNIDAEAA